MFFDPEQNFDGAEFDLLCSTRIMEQNLKKVSVMYIDCDWALKFLG